MFHLFVFIIDRETQRLLAIIHLQHVFTCFPYWHTHCDFKSQKQILFKNKTMLGFVFLSATLRYCFSSALQTLSRHLKQKKKTIRKKNKCKIESERHVDMKAGNFLLPPPFCLLQQTTLLHFALCYSSLTSLLLCFSPAPRPALPLHPLLLSIQPPSSQSLPLTPAAV